MRFKGFAGLVRLLGAVLACVLVAQVAMAAEGMGAHRGSFMFVPYWTTEAPFLNAWRVTNATELNDPTLPVTQAPEGKEGANYDNNPIQLHIFMLETPDCRELDFLVPFTPNDYRLLLVHDLVGAAGRSGWAFAYAVIKQQGPSPQIALWDRFFGESIIVNTADGWSRAISHYQQWGKNDGQAVPLAQFDFGPLGTCQYSRDRTPDFDPSGAFLPTNDICTYGPDNIGFNLSVLGPVGGQTYWPLLAPSSFYSNYFTEKFKFGNARAEPTEFSITPIDTLSFIFSWFGSSFSSGAGTFLDFFYDAIVYDSDENVRSVPEDIVICQEVRDIHTLTGGRSDQAGFKQGWVHFWAILPPGSTLFGNEDAAAVLTWGRFPQGNSDFAWGYWTTHNKTSVDDPSLHGGLQGIGFPGDDFNPDAP